jgi:hypothetical protein
MLANFREHLHPCGARHQIGWQPDHRRIAERRLVRIHGERLLATRRGAQRASKSQQSCRPHGSIR